MASNSIEVDTGPALELVRRILLSPNGKRHALHMRAMLADLSIVEIIPHPHRAGLLAVPSLELMRLADECGVERVS